MKDPLQAVQGTVIPLAIGICLALGGSACADARLFSTGGGSYYYAFLAATEDPALAENIIATFDGSATQAE